MATYLFADGNWLLYRAWSAVGKVYKDPYKKVPMMLLDWFCKAALRLQATGGAMCFDGNDNFRKRLYPPYKAHREVGEPISPEGTMEGISVSDAVYASLDPTKELFYSLGIPIDQQPKYEADDLMISGANYFAQESKSNRIYLMTRDKDTYQGITDQVTIFVPEMKQHPEELIGLKQLLKKKGLSPKQFLSYQILIGDATDNVPPISDMTPKKALQIAKEFTSLPAFFRTKEGGRFYNEKEDELHRNKDLITLVRSAWRIEDVSFKAHLKGRADSLAFNTLKSSVTKSSLF